MTFSIKVDISQLGMDELVADAEAAARPAAQAGAQVLYEAVQRNVNSIKRHSGNLARSIYQAYSRDNSGQGRATYHVSWNAKKAPHGHLVEWGHLQRYVVYFDEAGRFFTDKKRPLTTPKIVQARPFVRPAVAQFPQAEAAMRERWLAELAKQGHVR
jgi:HK97 gp10 family phage protein